MLLTQRWRWCGQSSVANQREDGDALASFQLQSIVLGAEMKSDKSLEARLSLHRCELQDDKRIARSVNPFVELLQTRLCSQK